MTQNKTYKISSSNQYAGYSFCITMYEDGKSNYIIGNLPFYRYDTCKIQSLKSSEKINFYKRVESDKWAYYVKLDDNANCIMTVNMSSVIDVVETTEDISSMTQIIPSIDNFGYNSLAELSAGVSPYLFAGVGNNSGLKSGTFTLKTGESISIALGAGVLMLFTDGGQVFSLLGINYWTTEIKTIYTDGRSLNITVTKNDTSGTVTFTAASNRKFHYIFFGE